MRKYRAVIIDFKKILRRGAAFFIMGTVSAAGIWAAGSRLMGIKAPSEIIAENIPAAMAEGNEGTHLPAAGRWAAKLLLGFVPNDDESVIGGTMPVYSAVAEGPLIAISRDKENEKARTKDEAEETAVAEPKIETEAINTLEEIPPENRAPIKEVDASQRVAGGEVAAIGNETSYSVDVNGMLAEPLGIDMSVKGPKMLIVHTHATESYAPAGAEVYDKTASDRNEDRLKNVVAVGTEMKAVFDKKGIETLHDEELHDAPSFNGSYAHSLESVKRYIEKYPSIQIVLDIHRDSIVYDDESKAKLVTEINGEKTAQLMIVVGTDENGLYNPNWRSNMQAALHFQRAICEKHQKLMRHINLRRERFNGHTSKASMIFEVGTSGNSLDEAKRGARLAAECIADYLNSL